MLGKYSGKQVLETAVEAEECLARKLRDQVTGYLPPGCVCMGRLRDGAKQPRVVAFAAPGGDLLMECLLEADPPPTISWQHAGNVISPSSRVVQVLSPLEGTLYKANLIIKQAHSYSAASAGRLPPPDFGGLLKCYECLEGQAELSCAVQLRGWESKSATGHCVILAKLSGRDT
ncbi:unnamed protein product [Heligmosomoides polygyrus]|uniref:Ig-like domain-containing protein n=1 Tax=Heligmosomoides polygyrus TaxID=6339 RepID=A0A183FHX3_HELPZ|nr:unnamed protein product [Heligmosomoides polygyrus]